MKSKTNKLFSIFNSIMLFCVVYLIICTIYEIPYNPFISKDKQDYESYELVLSKNESIHANENSFHGMDIMYIMSLNDEQSLIEIKNSCDSILKIILENRNKIITYKDSIKNIDPHKYKLLDSLNQTKEGQFKQYKIINEDLINWYYSTKK